MTHRPLNAEELALLTRYAVAMIDDERVASFSLRLLAEHVAQRKRIVELERNWCASNRAIAELERERDDEKARAGTCRVDQRGRKRSDS